MPATRSRSSKEADPFPWAPAIHRDPWMGEGSKCEVLFKPHSHTAKERLSLFLGEGGIGAMRSVQTIPSAQPPVCGELSPGGTSVAEDSPKPCLEPQGVGISRCAPSLTVGQACGPSSAQPGLVAGHRVQSLCRSLYD